MNINGIKLELTGEEFQIAGRGTVWTAVLQDNYTSKDVSEGLMNQTINNKVITGIEMFSTMFQHVGRNIGLLVRDKEFNYE